MFDIIKVLFFLIGVLVTLLFLCKVVITIILYVKRHGNPDKYWSIVRHSMFSDNCDSYWFFIPTIAISYTQHKYVEVTCRFLKWEYYTSYELSNEV